MIQINHAVLHVYDMLSNITIYSQKELDLSGELHFFLDKHLQKSMGDVGLKSGKFYEDSGFLALLNDYVGQELDFLTFSTQLAEQLFALLAHSDEPQPADLIIADTMVDGAPMLAVLLCSNKTGYVHQVVHEGEAVANTIIQHYAILPGVNQRVEECFFVNLLDSVVRFHEKKRSIDGRSTLLFSEGLLGCSREASAKETVKLIHEAVQEVAQEYGEDSVATFSRLKNKMLEYTEEDDSLCPFDLADEVFEHSPEMREHFAEKLTAAGVPEVVQVDRDYVTRAEKLHKIKTDTGIELSFPAEYYQNTDMIEFINNPNGTFSIQLKNIGKIINK